MIECPVTQGCEVGITVRHNGNEDILRLFVSVFIVTSNPTAHVWCRGLCGGAASARV